MSLAVGTRLGPYEVLSRHHEERIGEFFRGRDTRLGREVLVRVLPDEVAGDERALGRFESEYKAVSALSHPNILALYDVGESGGIRYAIAEWFEGQLLGQVLATGPLPARRTLHIAVQVADALATAHANGFVHRDLRPGRVLLGKDDHVKLAGFGVARDDVSRRDTPDTRSPKAPSPAGEELALERVSYVSPERARGALLDYRSDQFSLGSLLYHMVTGKRPFEGASAAETAAAILDAEPEPLETAAPGLPAQLRWCIERCLSKDPDGRYDSTSDLARDLASCRAHLQRSAVSSAAARPAERRRPRLRNFLAGAGLLAAGALLAFLVRGGLRAPAASRLQVVRSLLDVAPADELLAGPPRDRRYTPAGPRTAMAWTPDGRALVFVGVRGGIPKIHVHPLDAPEGYPLDGTEGASSVAVSPDGKWVAFWSTDGIRRVPLGGGPVETVLDGRLARGLGIGWGDGDRLFYEDSEGGISSVASGRVPTVVTRLRDDEVSHDFPQPLPGGRALLHTVRQRIWTSGDENVVVQVLDTEERKLLVHDGTDARWVPYGYLVFLRRGTLFGVRFDPSRLEVRGKPVPLLEPVAQALIGPMSGDSNGSGQFAVSSGGSLAWLPGATVPRLDSDLAEIDRQGRVTPLAIPRRGHFPFLALSPDGRRMAFTTRTVTDEGLWLHDFGSGKSEKLPAGGEFVWPRWTPDGRRLSFSWLFQGVKQLAWQETDGASGPERLLREDAAPSSWSPDGRHLAVVRNGDIRIVTFGGGTPASAPFLQTPEEEAWPEFSPDGRCLAYGSDTSGRFEVYVRPFPGPGRPVLVSRDGGESPAWSASGGELFFLSPPDPDGRREMKIVEVGGGSEFTATKPRRLFVFSQPPLRLRCMPSRCYAVSPDGQRFYATRSVDATPLPPVTKIHLVQNWVEELKARVEEAK